MKIYMLEIDDDGLEYRKYVLANNSLEACRIAVEPYLEEPYSGGASCRILMIHSVETPGCFLTYPIDRIYVKSNEC